MANSGPQPISLHKFAIAKGYYKPKKLKRRPFTSKCKRRVIKSEPPSEPKPVKPPTKIYAAGCNAWHNLDLAEPARPQQQYSSEPEDIRAFSIVFEGDSLSDLRAFLSWTTCRINGTRQFFGVAPYSLGLAAILQSVQNGKGEVAIMRPKHKTILLWPNLKAYALKDLTRVVLRQPRPRDTADPRPITQIAAWETGFVMLDDESMVYTVGDERYGQCLGRDITKDRPANIPCVVDALLEPVEKTKKVVAGGYTVAALTFDGQIYAWGMASPGSSAHAQAIPGLDEMPSYQQVGNDEEIADLALGDSHAIALTRKGHLYVIGNNTQGQLGLGDDQRRDAWTKVDFNLAGGHQVKEVVAGPQSSFFITRLGEEDVEMAGTETTGTKWNWKQTALERKTAAKRTAAKKTAAVKKKTTVKKTAAKEVTNAGKKRARGSRLERKRLG